MNKLTAIAALKILISIIFALLITVAILLVTYSYVEEPIKASKPERLSYIPVLIDDHQVNLIHVTDTIKLYLENAGALQDEYVVFVEQ